jgi:hypothetical protein
LTAKRRLPQQRTRTRIQRKKVPFLAAAEHDITGRGSTRRPGDVGHLVLPLRLQCVRIVARTTPYASSSLFRKFCRLIWPIVV